MPECLEYYIGVIEIWFNYIKVGYNILLSSQSRYDVHMRAIYKSCRRTMPLQRKCHPQNSVPALVDILFFYTLYHSAN